MLNETFSVILKHRGINLDIFRRKSVLILKNLQESNRGIYTCFAHNVLGNSSIDFFVDIENEKSLEKWDFCPVFQDFCLNQGLCRFYPSIGEMLCL